MAFYWPRIYRFLDRSSIAYHLDDLPAEGQPGSLGLTSSRPPARVDMWFHPGLTSPRYPFRVLFGTLAHEGLHGIRFAVAREFSLSAEQTRRLVYSHSIGRVPPGYGERLQHLCAHVQGLGGSSDLAAVGLKDGAPFHHRRRLSTPN